ncbi:MAG: helix-turn-helix domain-containing protein [Sphingobacterium composti]
MKNKEITIKDKIKLNTLLKVAEFENNKRQTQAHKHNGYLELVLLTKTSGKHIIDGREHIVKTPCLLIIQQNNVHHWSLNAPVEGYVLLLKKAFIDECLDLEITQLIHKITALDMLYLQDSYPLQEIFRILSCEDNRICQEGLLRIILSKSLESKQQISSPTTLSLDLFKRFNVLLSNNTTVVNNVAHYALLLNTTPQNLNFICKKHTNNTASKLIAEQILKEAKRLLIYTESTIAEIGYSLGFSDKSNFTKFFKRHEQITPQEFKNQRLHY